MRDYATIEQLIVFLLWNGLLINKTKNPHELIFQLNNVAITQMKSLFENSNLLKKIE